MIYKYKISLKCNFRSHCHIVLIYMTKNLGSAVNFWITFSNISREFTQIELRYEHFNPLSEFV